MAQAEKPVKEEFKQKFQLCHTIQLSKNELSQQNLKKSRENGMKTMCGSNLHLEKHAHGFYLNGEPVLSIAKSKKVIVLVDFILAETHFI